MNKNINKKKAAVTESKNAQKSVNKYTLRQKLLPAILLSLAAPMTVCFFGPFDLYYGNMNEFLFSLGDFLPFCLFVGLLASALIFAVLVLLNGIAFEIGCGAVAGISIMLFVQRNYLNFGATSIAGDAAGVSEINVVWAIFNLLIWVAVIAGCVFASVYFRKKDAETVTVVAVIAMVALIGMQTVSFAVSSLTSRVFMEVTERAALQNSESNDSAGEPQILTYENMGELSENKNIVFFLVDRFDAKYYRTMVKKYPDFFNSLDGFTYFDDYTSLYCRTYPAVASILTGKDHDFNNSKNQAFNEFYSDGGHMGTLKDNGYNINLYTEKNYVYTDASVFKEYVDNVSGIEEYYVDSNAGLASDMLRLSLSQFLPVFAQDWTGHISTNSINAHAVYEATEDMYTVNEDSTELLYNYLCDNEFGKVTTKGQFTFIHLFGCHDTSKSTEDNIKGTFEVIYYYIDQMKAMGIYDDATIVITGDHSAALSDSKMIGAANSKDDGTRVTAMLFKKSGDFGTELKTSTAQISQDELWNTIFESEGILEEKKGDSFFDIPEGEERERRYFFEMYKNSKNNDLKYNRVYEYKITGTANNGENWEIVGETDIIK